MNYRSGMKKIGHADLKWCFSFGIVIDDSAIQDRYSLNQTFKATTRMRSGKDNGVDSQLFLSN